MRVCIFGSEFGPVKKEIFVGGAAVSAVRLGRVLHALGDVVFVFSSAPRGRSSRIYKFKWGVVVNKRIPGRYNSLTYNILFFLISLLGLWSFCRHKKIHVISSHSGSVLLSIIPSIIGRFLRIPVIHTQYCVVDLEQQSWVMRAFSYPLAKLCLKLLTRFVAISHNVYHSLMKAGLSIERLDRIPPIIPFFENDSNSHYTHRKLLGLKHEDFVAIFVGNLKKNKGIDVLLRALHDLTEEGYRLKLIITTELVHKAFSERKKALSEYVLKHDLVNSVFWLDIVADIHALLCEADVLVVPFLNLRGISDYPLVVLEAISAGTPVIASDVGGIREILQDEETGIMVPPGDAEALCKALRSIVTNKELKYRLKDGVQRYPLHCYDAYVVGRKYRELFLQEVNKIGW